MQILRCTYFYGEVSYISNRYKKADNEYWKSYDLEQESKHVNL